MNDLYERAVKDELEKIAADEDNPSRIRSAAKGALRVGLGMAALGALAGGAVGFREYNKALKKIMKKKWKKGAGMYSPKKSAEGLAALNVPILTTLGLIGGGASGAVIGGARGAIYPKGRKTWGGKRSKVGS